MPYPAPYGAGAGTFIIEGTAKGAILGLTPTQGADRPSRRPNHSRRMARREPVLAEA